MVKLLSNIDAANWNDIGLRGCAFFGWYNVIWIMGEVMDFGRNFLLISVYQLLMRDENSPTRSSINNSFQTVDSI